MGTASRSSRAFPLFRDEAPVPSGPPSKMLALKSDRRCKPRGEAAVAVDEVEPAGFRRPTAGGGRRDARWAASA
jgi:hypothetical protein